MAPAPTCGICAGRLALLHPGRADGLTARAFSPTCHAPGAHGDLYACRTCGTVQQPALPRGKALLELYRDMEDEAYLAEEKGRRATARRLLRRLEREVRPPGRLLDVGCGHGLLADEARRRGWSVLGLEPALGARAHARERLGLDVRDATLHDLDPAMDGPFDAIVLADVLEHLEDPVGALSRCAALLADGGAICVVTPDPSSRTARIAGPRWWGFLPAHAHLLPRATLRRVLADRGLEPVSDVGLWRTFTLAYWLAGLRERAGAAARVAGGLARLPAGRLAVTLSLGDERVVVARRGSAARAASAVSAPVRAAVTVPPAAS